MIDIKVRGLLTGPTAMLDTVCCFYVGSDLWPLLKSQGYQLQLVPYTDWYEKVKDTARSSGEHSATLANLLYLLDAVIM
jgi:hypothetical protein